MVVQSNVRGKHQVQQYSVYLVGNNTNLTTGRTIFPARVSTLATLTRPLLLRNTSVTRPSRQDNGGLWLSITMTISLKLRFGASEVHLDRSWSVVKYSEDQRRQKVWWHWSSNFYRLDISRTDAGSDLGGTANKGCPIKKCPGVRQSWSCGSVEAGVSGRELSTALTRVKIVENSS